MLCKWVQAPLAHAGKEGTKPKVNMERQGLELHGPGVVLVVVCACQSTVQCFSLTVSFLYLFMCLFSGLGCQFSKAATAILYSLCIVPDFVPHTENWGMLVGTINETVNLHHGEFKILSFLICFYFYFF